MLMLCMCIFAVAGLGSRSYHERDAHVGALILLFSGGFGVFRWWKAFDTIHKLDRFYFLAWYLVVVGGGVGVILGLVYAIAQYLRRCLCKSSQMRAR